MTTLQNILARVAELYPYKNGKFPICFPQYPEVDFILGNAPKLARALEIAMQTLRNVNGDPPEDLHCDCFLCKAILDIEKLFEADLGEGVRDGT
jgi:hypothetical protein